MERTTAILDYGVGNLKSITNAFSFLGLTTQITADPLAVETADAIVLPGVGAFPDAADRLKASGLQDALLHQVGKKPILGICLGMQLLFDAGEEVRPAAGLGLVHGTVKKIETDFKLPHIGWNSLTFHNDSPLFKGLSDGVYVYFVHSFCGVADIDLDVIAKTEYGAGIVAAVGRNGVYGCQFHPEKSGETGLQIIRNFGEMCR
jgi:glutamine amidotransferase